jgi:AcrR family transcriptional regulator
MTKHQPRDYRREQVLDAALKLFVKHGYEDSTVDEISRDAGLSKGSIYWYFDSKLDILFALTDRYTAQSQAEVVRMAGADKYGTEALYKSHRDLRRADEKDPNREKLLSQLMGLAARYPEIRTKMREYYRQWDDVVTELIERAVKEGKFSPVDARSISQAITALYDGLCMRQQIDSEVDVITVIETTMRLVHEALVKHVHSQPKMGAKELV